MYNSGPAVESTPGFWESITKCNNHPVNITELDTFIKSYIDDDVGLYTQDG